MTGPMATDRQERILAGKLDLLFRGHIAVPGNMLAALLVAYLLHGCHPTWFLLLWLGGTCAVGVARLYLHRCFRNAEEEQPCRRRWAHLFTLGTFGSGLMWGVICASLAIWGDAKAYVLLTFVVGGMTAGSVATFSPYMPAYLAYASPMTLSLSVASLLSRDEVITGNGILILFYFVVVTLTCVYSSRFVDRTVKLQVDNEILRNHLRKTRRERDTARREKWSTLAQLSHELRTPLNAIMGFSEAMREEVLGALGNRRYKDYASHIHASGRRLLTLADELMLISQGEAGSLSLREEPVDVGEMVSSLLAYKKTAAEKAGLTLAGYIASGLPKLNADKAKLRQMLRHLVDNAIKFTPAGGSVSLAVVLDSEGGMEITVEDTGIGIDAKNLARVLRPFARVATPLTDNTGGAGLGLPIVARLAELHDAKLNMTSEPGQGTRVLLRFPPKRCLVGNADSAAA